MCTVFPLPSFIIAAILSAVAIGQLLAHQPIVARSQGRAPVQPAIVTSGKEGVTIHQFKGHTLRIMLYCQKRTGSV